MPLEQVNINAIAYLFFFDSDIREGGGGGGLLEPSHNFLGTT